MIIFLGLKCFTKYNYRKQNSYLVLGFLVICSYKTDEKLKREMRIKFVVFVKLKQNKDITLQHKLRIFCVCLFSGGFV